MAARASRSRSATACRASAVALPCKLAGSKLREATGHPMGAFQARQCAGQACCRGTGGCLMSSAARSSLAGRSVSTPQKGARPERCINDVSADVRERPPPTVPALGVKLGVARRCGIKNLDIAICKTGDLAERLAAELPSAPLRSHSQNPCGRPITWPVSGERHPLLFACIRHNPLID
jgi:hypothetical protein